MRLSDKRINARHIRDMEAAGMTRIAVNEDYLLGRVLATSVVDPQTGEVLADANAEITEELLQKMRAAAVGDFRTIYAAHMRELDAFDRGYGHG